MSEPFVGEIRLAAFTFAPQGWSLCNGQIVPISQNEALFSLIGTTYGGDGRQTFGLPDLRGRLVVGTAGDYPLGLSGGESSHVLTVGELPTHTHQGAVSPTATAVTPSSATVLAQPGKAAYATTATTTMAPNSVSLAGGSQAHENTAPSLVLNYIIALAGVYPPRS